MIIPNTWENRQRQPNHQPESFWELYLNFIGITNQHQPWGAHLVDGMAIILKMVGAGMTFPDLKFIYQLIPNISWDAHHFQDFRKVAQQSIHSFVLQWSYPTKHRSCRSIKPQQPWEPLVIIASQPSEGAPGFSRSVALAQKING